MRYKTFRFLLAQGRNWRSWEEQAGEYNFSLERNVSGVLMEDSGKSSLVLLLLRLLDPLPSCSEDMTVDGIPLHTIHRSTLRSRIIAMPQDPFFLPDGSTFMTNLDPYGTASVQECQAVLQTIGLAELINGRGGIQGAMSPGSFSEGQKQLFSVGRAILRARQKTKAMGQGDKVTRGGVLLLDEITSSVDRDTDALIQKIIRDEFEGYTIIAIAHRVDTIMDFDRVVVMEEGRIKEMGDPKTILGSAVSPVEKN
jgi:ATP-binding cassette subfamily C (CFTR/MRP) protein 1